MQYIGLLQTCRVRADEIIRTLQSKFLVDVRTKSTALNLSYKIYGRSPTPDCMPIFVLPDCLGTKFNWDSMCRKLTISTKKPVIAVDARNHGDSPYCDSHDYDSLAADVLQIINEFEVDNSIIIGHGMGGRTGMTMALNEPSKIASLAVVDISPVSTPRMLADTFPKIIDVLLTVDFKGLDLYQAKAAARKTILENNLFDNNAEIQALLLNISKLPDNSIGWKYNLKTLKNEFNNITTFPDISGTKYSGPTLFLAGKLSYYIPPDDIPEIRELFPAATFLYFDGVNHNVHTEDPTGFLSSLMTFFDYNSLIKTQS